MVRSGIAAAALVLAAPVCAQDIAPYLQGGISGFGVGVSIGTGTPIRVRADLYHGMTANLDQTESGVRYTGKLKYAESGLYLDWYPTPSRFRISGGLFFNRSKLDLTANAGPGVTAEINGRVYAMTGDDTVTAKVTYPSTMPYLGVGWGFGSFDRGWNLVADVGLAFGRPSTTLDASASLRAKVTAAGLNADNELAAERQQLQDSVRKFFAYPVARIGVGYRF